MPSSGVHDEVSLGEVREKEAQLASHKTGIALTGAALLAIAIGGGIWLGLSGPDNNVEIGGEPSPTKEEPADQSASLFAVAEANLRDRPTLRGSTIIGALKRGERATGLLMSDERGKAWLKLDRTGQFVSLANLSKTQPPRLKTLDGSDLVTTARCSVLDAPAAGAMTKKILKTGAAIRLVGSTADGFAELALPGGGVGYTPSSAACDADPSPAEGAVANALIELDPRTCNFGPQIGRYFETARERLERQGHGGAEEQFSFPVNKRFRGLEVTSIRLGYEWDGIVFNDPVSKVRTVFRGMGFEVDEEGNFAMPDDTAVVTTLRAIEPGDVSGGQSELVCGL